MAEINNTSIIIKTAKKIGAKVTPVSKFRYAYKIRYKGKEFIITSKFVIRDNSVVSSHLTKLKDITYEILSQAKIRTPKSILITENGINEKNKILLSRLSLPLVIKDARGSNSKGVFTDIKSITEAVEIIKREIKKYKKLLVQEMVFGNEYRVLVLDDRIIGVLNLIPPYIIGNGKSKTRILIEKKQENTMAKTPADLSLKKILRDQRESLESVPIKGKKVFLRNNSCLAEGGASVDETERISDKMKKICIQTAKVTGLKLAGIDLLYSDISHGEKDYSIIEINGKPDIYIHHFPTYGKKKDVAKEILEYIFSKAL